MTNKTKLSHRDSVRQTILSQLSNFFLACENGIRKVTQGARKVTHGVRKVTHGVRKVTFKQQFQIQSEFFENISVDVRVNEKVYSINCYYCPPDADNHELFLGETENA